MLVDLLGPRPVYAAVGAVLTLGTLPVVALLARLGVAAAAGGSHGLAPGPSAR